LLIERVHTFKCYILKIGEKGVAASVCLQFHIIVLWTAPWKDRIIAWNLPLTNQESCGPVPCFLPQRERPIRVPSAHPSSWL